MSLHCEFPEPMQAANLLRPAALTVRLRDVWHLCLVCLVLDVTLGPWLPEPFYHSADRVVAEGAARFAFCVVLSIVAWRERARRS